MSDIERARDALFCQINDLFGRFRADSSLPDEIVTPEQVTATIDTSLMDKWHTERQILEPDLLPFRRLDEPGAVVIDCGANVGVTAITLLTLLPRAVIHALEPAAKCHGMLRRLAELEPRFSWAAEAAGAEDTEMTAYAPVVNGVPILAMSSIGGATFEEWLARYISTLVGVDWLPVRDSYIVTLMRQVFAIRRLDTIVLDDPSWAHRARSIAGIKVDVEGHEFEAIAGAARVLEAYQPLLMIEVDAAKHADLAAVLGRLGYVPASRVDDQLRLMAGGTPHYNAYFLHGAREAEYRTRGLVVD